MRPIDADALSAFVGDLRNTLHKEQSTFKAMTDIEFNTRDYMLLNFQQTIDNAPTVERPTGECKTCKYYHPYFEQFTNIPRGDGYCVIARMTPEGMTTINCNDEFGCSDYQKGGAK